MTNLNGAAIGGTVEGLGDEEKPRTWHTNYREGPTDSDL